MNAANMFQCLGRLLHVLRPVPEQFGITLDGQLLEARNEGCLGMVLLLDYHVPQIWLASTLVRTLH